MNIRVQVLFGDPPAPVPSVPGLKARTTVPPVPPEPLLPLLFVSSPRPPPCTPEAED